MLEKKKTTKGVLDYLDIFVGRLSDSDQAGGGRKRSFGVTFCTLMQIPLLLYITAVAYALVFRDLPVVKGKKVAFVFGGWPIVGLCIFASLLGFVVMTFRREQDYKKLKGMSEVAIEWQKASSGKSSGSDIEKHLGGILSHLENKESGELKKGGNPKVDLAEENIAEKLTGGR